MYHGGSLDFLIHGLIEIQGHGITKFGTQLF
jgi:hypothetical protein